MFKRYDRVVIDGNLFKGRAEVLWYATEKPKGERAYGIPYDPVYPQFGTKSVEPDTFGDKLLYNQDDVDAGKVRHATREELTDWPESPWPLSRILDSITVTAVDFSSESYTLRQSMDRYRAILESLLDEPCTSKQIGMHYDLEEFDSDTIVIDSAIKGQMMRNDGVPAFRLEIQVDGYAPTTFSLHLTEVYTP